MESPSRSPELSDRGQWCPGDRVSLQCHMPGLHRTGDRTWQGTAATLLRRKQHQLSKALLTGKLQGQALPAQPAVFLGPPCIKNYIIGFMLHNSQAVLCKEYDSMLFLFSEVCSHGLNFRIYLLPTLPQIYTLSTRRPLLLSAPQLQAPCHISVSTGRPAGLPQHSQSLVSASVHGGRGAAGMPGQLDEDAGL